MRYLKCSKCNNEQIPANNTISVDKINYCVDCFNEIFKSKKELKGKMVSQNFDPSVCTSCSKDFGDRVLNKIGSFPVCDECNLKIKEKISPLWVKLFFATVLAIVIFSFVWNWRFLQAHDELEESVTAFSEQKFRLAADQMKSAYNHAKEVSDLRALASYYNGMALLQENKSEEALEEFGSCKNVLPKDYQIDELILQAEMGAGFESKDYNRFLSAANDLLQRDSSNTMAWASVASAYACLYASSDNDSLKDLSKWYLSHVADAKDDPNVGEYFNRIEHRLATKEIIEKEDFDKRYPNGWSEN